MFYFEKPIAYGSTCQIEDQIVNIAGADEEKHLSKFNQGNDPSGKEECFPKRMEAFMQQGRQETQREEQEHISEQVDNSMTNQLRAVWQQKASPKQLNCAEGYGVEMLLQQNRIGERRKILFSEEEKIQHSC